MSNSAIPWTVAYQAPSSMEFSRQEYWSGLPFPSPGELSDPGVEPRSPDLLADTLPPAGKPSWIHKSYNFYMSEKCSASVILLKNPFYKSIFKKYWGQTVQWRIKLSLGFPGGSEVKVSACNAGNLGSIPGSGRSPGEGNGKPLQYSCLENPMDGGAWWATVHGVARSRTRLSDFTLQAVTTFGLDDHSRGED